MRVFAMVESDVFVGVKQCVSNKELADRWLAPMTSAWQIVQISFGKPFVFVSFLS